jgi:hypothetical protein
VLDIDRIRGKFGKTTGTYIAGTIPDTKLENARKTYAPDIPAGDVLMVYDDTVFGSAKDGFLLTTSGIYWRNSFENPDRLEFRELTTVDSKLAVVTSLVFVNGRKINFGGNQDAAAALAALLKEVLQVT